MSHPQMIQEIIETTSIPVMAKARIGHSEEARVLEQLGVDMIDESEVLTPADPFFHIPKNDFTPFVCGCTNLGEAVRRIAEGAAMIRTKGEAGTGNVVSAVQHAVLVSKEIEYAYEISESSDSKKYEEVISSIMDGYNRVKKGSKFNLHSKTTPFGKIEELRSEVESVISEVVQK